MGSTAYGSDNWLVASNMPADCKESERHEPPGSDGIDTPTELIDGLEVPPSSLSSSSLSCFSEAKAISSRITFCSCSGSERRSAGGGSISALSGFGAATCCTDIDIYSGVIAVGRETPTPAEHCQHAGAAGRAASWLAAY